MMESAVTEIFLPGVKGFRTRRNSNMVRCAFDVHRFLSGKLPLMTVANAAKLSCEPLILLVGAPEEIRTPDPQIRSLVLSLGFLSCAQKFIARHQPIRKMRRHTRSDTRDFLEIAQIG
jgi:hypothetical protein